MPGLFAACCLLMALEETMPAEAADKIEPAASARQALESGRFPWYDAQLDRLKPIQLPAPAIDRKLPKLHLPELRYLFLTLLGLVMAALVAGLLWALYRRSALAGDRPIASAAPESRISVDALPFLRGRRGDNLLEQARALYAEGNYSEAIIYLFSYQLAELDRFAHLRLARGKTNREYARETRNVPLKHLLEQTMVAFEDVFFGGQQLDQGRFESCWQQMPQFEQLAAEGAR
ncbi:MAG TPA: DUF4129 domain-containing protein [Pirellulales bacterium]|nr:DUF4129 domain-containing protein [Pirellulales bacterium]